MKPLFKGIGITGAHRVGKSTLAKAAAEKYGLQFCETRCSEVFQTDVNGKLYKPSDDIPFMDRLVIQTRMIQHLLKRYAEMTGPFVADRTPVDVVAYLFAEIRGATIAKEDRNPVSDAMNFIAESSIYTCETYLSGVVHLQPGIDLVEGVDKAVACPMYIRHINMLTHALVHGWAGSVFSAYTIPHSVLSVNERVEHVGNFYQAILSHQRNAQSNALQPSIIH